MNIVFLNDDFPPSPFTGASVVAYNLAKGLKKRGHKIFIITTIQNKFEEGTLVYEGIKIFRVYSNYHARFRAYRSLYNYQTVFKVKKILKDLKPDISHFHNIHYHLSYKTIKIAKKFSKSVFLTAHDAMLFSYSKYQPKHGNCVYKLNFYERLKEAKKRFNPFREIVIRYYLNYVDKIFSISNVLKNMLAINGIKNVATVYNAIDLSEWRVEVGKIKDFKAKFNLNGKEVIFFGGRLSDAKGGMVIVRAMSQIIKEFPESILLVAGRKDQFAEAILGLAETLKLQNNIVFTGWLDRQGMKAAFHSSDVCLTPSLYCDPFNLFNIESGAAKKPVVGTCFGGTPEIILNKKTGYIVNPNDINQMSDKIIRLLKNPRQAQALGQAGYDRIKDKFSIDLQVDETLKWYQLSLNEKIVYTNHI